MKKGGKFLGKGSYGCVFDPPLLCDKKLEREKGVGKLFQEKSDAIEEKVFSKITDLFLLPK